MRLTLLSALAAAVLALSSPAAAQPPVPARLLVTVADPSNAVIVQATVTIADDANPSKTFAPVMTSDKGLAVFENLAPGRYTIHAAFPGFDEGTLRDVRVRTGDNKHVVILPLKKLETAVTVGQEPQAAALDIRGNSFTSELSREEIEALSDDPNEMAQQLLDMASAGAIIRIDSFFGGALPPKSQIQSIHIVRDTFAAENHSGDVDEIQIVTRPGSGPVHGGLNSRFRDGAMSGENLFTGTTPPEQSRIFDGNLGGTVVANKSSFSLSVGKRTAWDTPIVFAATPSGVHSQALNLRRPDDNWSVNGLFDYAVSRNQTLRMTYNQSANDRENLGVGAYDLPDRAYSTSSTNHEFRAQVTGPIGRRTFGNTRFQASFVNVVSHSAVEAPTIIVNGAFNSGGAQIAGGRHPRTLQFASDIDYVRSIHTVRYGTQIDTGHYRTDDATNYLGTYTYTSLAAYNAGRAATFTQRIGDPLVEYSNTQAAAYFQDDIRLRKSLTLSPGVRYEAQTHVHDYNNFGPRFGITWAPFKSGRTTLRASGGIFYIWLNANTFEQTLRVDGLNQQEVNIVDPTVPVTAPAGGVVAANKYLLDDNLQSLRNARASVGIDQTLSPFVRVNLTYSDLKQTHALRGLNLNAPVHGVRPDPAFANVIEAESDAWLRSKQLATTLTVSLAPSGRAANDPRWNWRRTNVRLNYWLQTLDNNTDGAFIPPPTGTLATEWAPSPGDRRHRVALAIGSTALKNLNLNVSLAGNSGLPYTITTGVDTNGDQIFNDRPAGVGRDTVRAAAQFTWSSTASYAIAVGGPGVARPQERERAQAPPGGTGAGRFQLVLFLNIQNLTNRANLVGYSGVMTSPFFLQPTAVANPRKIDFGFNVRF